MPHSAAEKGWRNLSSVCNGCVAHSCRARLQNAVVAPHVSCYLNARASVRWGQLLDSHAVMQILSFAYWGILCTLLVAYYCASRKAQAWLLLAASLGFCASWDPRSALVLAVTCVLDYGLTRHLAWERSERTRKLALFASVTLNIGTLLALKYARFWAGHAPHELAGISSVGVSFYSLVRLTHTLDAYYRVLQPARSLLDFTVLVAFFPQLTAGPVERARHWLPQLAVRRNFELAHVYEASWLIGLGIFKKVFLADHCAVLVRRLLEPELGVAVSGVSTWLGLYAYALQIYADFGGYSDLARGTARLLGFQVMENFDAPYAATNLAQYWQRWHISLSSFLEDYLHRPLAFALRNWGESGAVCAIWATFLTSGLWHGTGWTFVVWGALHALGLSVYMLTRKLRKRLKKRVQPRLLSAAAWLVTFHYVCLGYAFFRAKSVSHALTTLQPALSGWRITDDVSHTWMPVAFYAAVTLLLDRAQRRGGAFWIFEQKVWVRALCYGALSMAVVRMFAPGTEFIYAEF